MGSGGEVSTSKCVTRDYPGSGPSGEVTPLVLPSKLKSTKVTELLLELFDRRGEKGLGHRSVPPVWCS